MQIIFCSLCFGVLAATDYRARPSPHPFLLIEINPLSSSDIVSSIKNNVERTAFVWKNLRLAFYCAKMWNSSVNNFLRNYFQIRGSVIEVSNNDGKVILTFLNTDGSWQRGGAGAGWRAPYAQDSIIVPFRVKHTILPNSMLQNRGHKNNVPISTHSIQSIIRLECRELTELSLFHMHK